MTANGIPLDPFEVAMGASREPPNSYTYRHRCDHCGGFLRTKPDREGPSTWVGAAWADYDCRKCGETTSSEY